ncbi:MAG: 4-hydroxy-tetrahydrodipicolinate reductase [Clostridia bacterium]|nr:4-hydroxy-tetrahydrodipicolinate reductase [Clostridia bacterium]
MIEIILVGCSGTMGHAVTAAVKTSGNLEIKAGIDKVKAPEYTYPIFPSFDEADGLKADVVVDFSNPAVFDSMLDYCLKTGTPLVACSTGLSDEQTKALREAAKKIPVFKSANMSLGVNLLCELVKTATRVLGDKYDIEIIEKHHNRKVDAPSGTALMIANDINSQLDNSMEYIYDRHSERKKRTKKEIGIHSVRGGTIVGEHEVIFAGTDEIITISHSAGSKALFATGAVSAALFIVKKEPGLYTMSDLLK